MYIINNISKINTRAPVTQSRMENNTNTLGIPTPHPGPVVSNPLPLTGKPRDNHFPEIWVSYSLILNIYLIYVHTYICIVYVNIFLIRKLFDSMFVNGINGGKHIL